MAKFNSGKLLKTLTSGQGAILTPHIDAYQERGKFPPKWEIDILNEKPKRADNLPILRFRATDALLTPEELFEKYTKEKEPETISAAMRRTLDCGNMWHGYFQNILLDMGLVKEGNIEKYVIQKIVTKRGYCYGSGQIDLFDVEIPGHGNWLVDFKSMNKLKFDQGLSGDLLLQYTLQVSLYMDWTGAEKGMILAVCKDSPHNLREYQVQLDRSLVDPIYDKWSYVAQCIRANLPADNEEYARSLR